MRTAAEAVVLRNIVLPILVVATIGEDLAGNSGEEITAMEIKHILYTDPHPYNYAIIDDFCRLLVDVEVDSTFLKLEALDMCATRKYDLIITGMSGTDIDGLEFLKRIRAVYPNQSCMMISGHEEAVEIAVATYGTHFWGLTKPFYLKPFLETVWSALGRELPFIRVKPD